jgi:hypothetical protein
VTARTEHRVVFHKIIPGALVFLLSVTGCVWGTLNGPGSPSLLTPEGSILVTMINADATKVYFTLDQEYTGEWKVYTDATGDARSKVNASFSVINDVPFLILTSAEPISPRTYYVSLKEEYKPESDRIALWGEPRVDPNPISLAKRFHLAERGYGIPDARLIEDGAGLLQSADGVRAVFSVLHAYLQDVRAGVAPMNDYIVPGILLGDWVDLPSLSVAEYRRSDNNVIADAINITSNTDLGDHGKLLRLIVVGNNSFHSGAVYWPPETARFWNDATPHLVFQFQNIPGTARMQTGSAGGGYKGSGMRGYLVKTEDDPNSGKFLDGLKNAGVPEDWLFAPIRYVTNNGKRYEYNWQTDVETKTDLATGADEIQDTVWLPTVREMFGEPDASNETYETAANQARLEYYTDNTARIKYNGGGHADWYWEASPGWALSSTSNGTFCEVTTGGAASFLWPDQSLGVAPAFCVR